MSKNVKDLYILSSILCKIFLKLLFDYFILLKNLKQHIDSKIYKSTDK